MKEKYSKPSSLYPVPEGHSSASRFEQVLRNGDFALTSEISPPDSVDPQEVYRRVRLFDGFVDAINVTDGSGAHCHMSSVATCSLLSRIGYSPIFQISCRDRNSIAIQGDVLGVAALNIGNVLALSGDGVQCGDHPWAKPVFELDSVSLLKTLRIMRDEKRFISGRKIDIPPNIFIGSSINPFRAPIENRIFQLEKKIKAGAQFIQSQYCCDIPMLKNFMRQARDLGLDKKAFILIGIGIIPSAKTAIWMRKNVPGVHIPDSFIKRLQGAKDQHEEAIKICIEHLQQVKEIEGISGIHLMAYRQEEYIGEVITKSGILGTRVPWALNKTTEKN